MRTRKGEIMIHLKEYPNDKYSFELYVNYDHLSIEKIKAQTGCTDLVNLWYFDMKKYAAAKTKEQVDASTDTDVMVNGKALRPCQYIEYGVIVNSSGGLECGTRGFNQNYACCCTPQYMRGEKDFSNKPVAANGATHIGFKADGTPVVAVALKNEPETNDNMNFTLLGVGCENILRFDGSWSSQAIMNGKVIKPSQERIVQGLLLMFEREEKKKEETPMEKTERIFKVCLDPGHGTAEMNCSPDKKYYEYKFAWDIANRVKELLKQTERFNIKLTKAREEETPGLGTRAATANAFGADVYVSIHSNAVSGGWNDKVHGSTAWIYALGGKRQELAQHILDRFTEESIELFGNKLYEAHFAVLGNTNMPAVLIENYFHTCRDDVDKLLDNGERDKMAYAIACGICEYFNVGADLVPLTEDEKKVEDIMHNDIIYRVQVGAFEDEGNAKALENLLMKQGYKTFITEEKR